MTYVIARPIKGISLNGNEYLLNNDGSVMEFKEKNDCLEFIKTVITDTDPEDYLWEEEDEQ